MVGSSSYSIFIFLGPKSDVAFSRLLVVLDCSLSVVVISSDIKEDN